MSNSPHLPVGHPRPVAPFVFGAVLIVLGLGWLLTALDIASIPWQALLAAVLIVIGAATAATASRDRDRGGLVGLGGLLVLVLAVASTTGSLLHVPLRGGFGDRTIAPQTMGDLENEYRLIAGQMVIDLGAVDLPDGETVVEASVALGHLVFENLPANAAVRAVTHVSAGEAVVFDETFSGIGIDEEWSDADFATARRRLVIVARAGLGKIEVRS